MRLGDLLPERMAWRQAAPRELSAGPADHEVQRARVAQDDSRFTNGTVPFATMRRDLEAMPEVAEAFTVAGKADAQVRVVAGDMIHLERVISRVRGLPYVQQTDTTLLLSRLLHRPMADPAASSATSAWSQERTTTRSGHAER